MTRQRKKKGRPISGWIIIDKPVGMGSTQCVGKIKWLYQAAKAGHAGTLDPLASGALPLALGEATRTVPYIMDGCKTYQFTVSWGAETKTDDLEGEVTKSSELRPSRDEIVGLLSKYTGLIEQIPPQFSAVKIDGERAYKRARDGEAVAIQPRKVEIESLELLKSDENSTSFKVVCGKGTYVRALARDMGRDLGCYGHVSALRRTAVGPFEEEDLLPIDTLQNLEGNLEALDSELYTTGSAFEDILDVKVNREQASRLRLGNSIVLLGNNAVAHANEAIAVRGNELIAIGVIEKGQFKPKRVFQHSFV